MAQESRLIITIDARNAERTARELARELENVQNSGNRAERQTNNLGSAFKSLAVAMAGIVTVGAAISKMDAYTNLQNRLKLVTNSQKELNKATEQTFAISQKTAQAWESVVQVYQRFSDNAKTLKINMDQVASITETVSKAVAVSGASTQAAEAALTQFGQALASGTLRGEELASVLEQTPALAKAIASGMGVTISQLRAVAAEGKVTSDVIVKALEKSKKSVDELFDKTDFSIGNSFTMLTNATTKFVGEAGKGSGAASLLSDSIRTLADNLSLIADVAVVGGVALLTKAIIAKTVAVRNSVGASIAQRAADVANAESQITLLGLEVQRTRSLQAQTLTELNLARAQYNDARTKAERAAATMRLTQAEIAHRAAVTQTTVAIAAQKAAQDALTASQTLGARALALVGGPIGAITLGVGALAAGYMVMKNRSAEATAKLEEQARVAEKTTNELLKLEGAQKSQARSDLAIAFKAQNDELKKSATLIGNYIAEISSKNTADAKTADILLKVRTNAMSYDDALKELNKTHADKPEIISKLTNEINKYEEYRVKAQQNADAQKALGVEVKLAGNASQNSVSQHNAQANALNSVEGAANGAASALSKYTQQALDAGKQAQIANTLMNKGFSAENAKDLAEVAAKSGKVTQAEAKAILYKNEQQEKLNKTIETQRKLESDANKARSKASSDALKEAKRLKKEAERLAEEQGQMRVSIAYEYLDELKKMDEDYQREIADIRKANFGAEQAEFEKQAKARYDYQHEMYLIQITEEINSFKWSENEKLNHWKRTQQEIIENSGRYNNEIKELKLKALDEEYLLEKAKLEISRKEREFQARKQFMTETDAMNERYVLEQANILLINDEHERTHLLELKRLEKEVEVQQKLNDARDKVSGIKSRQSGTTAFDDIYSTQAEANNASSDLMDWEVASGYKTQEEAQIEHLERMKANAQEAHEAMAQLQFSYGEQMTGSLADMFKTMGGEQSRGYRIMFAASKAFAIAQAAVSISQGIAQAAANPWPLNLAAMASVVAATASIVSNIKAVEGVGFQTGGYTGNGGVSDVAGVVHGQEYVLNANATKRVGVDTLNAINNGGSLGGSAVNITINTPAGYTATTKEDSNGVTIDVVEQKIAESWSKLARPNSTESRAIQSSFGLQPSR